MRVPGTDRTSATEQFAPELRRRGPVDRAGKAPCSGLLLAGNIVVLCCFVFAASALIAIVDLSRTRAGGPIQQPTDSGRGRRRPGTARAS